MADSSTDGSIFSEMAERRNRCEELHAKAVEQGLAVEAASPAVPEESEPEAAPEMKPAFDMDKIETGHVYENEIQKTDSYADETLNPVESELPIEEPSLEEEAIEEVFEIPADPVAESAPEEVEAIQELDTLDEPIETNAIEEESLPSEPFSSGLEEAAVEAPVSEPSEVEDCVDPVVEEEEPVDEVPSLEISEESEPAPEESSTEEVEPESVEGTVSVLEAETDEGEMAEASSEGEVESEDLSSPEELIEQGGNLLGEAPEPIPDAEVVAAAEELVDQIGSVVDIQSLPKTQPSRVMSKVAKSEEATKGPTPSEKVVAPEGAAGAKESQSVAKPDPTAAKAKKKKKKPTLLDSYFKGL